MLSTYSQEISQKDHERLAAFIAQNIGIQLPLHKQKLIETRLRKRLKAINKPNINEYLNFVLSERGNDEKVHMIDSLTTNKTDFFRENSHFEFLKQEVASKQVLSSSPVSSFPEAQARSFKVWSAACSTGEEPYSLAMTLADCQLNDSHFDFEILASDISTETLETARNAIYSENRIASISESMRKRYLLRSITPSQNIVKIAPGIRRKVSFKHFNLMGSNYPNANSFDVIFCRNVLIYFSFEDRLKVLAKLSQCLKEDGLLVLGHSESMSDYRKTFQSVGPTTYRKLSIGKNH